MGDTAVGEGVVLGEATGDGGTALGLTTEAPGCCEGWTPFSGTPAFADGNPFPSGVPLRVCAAGLDSGAAALEGCADAACCAKAPDETPSASPMALARMSFRY